MELRPFNREGWSLAVGAVVGYVMVLAAWIILVRVGQGEAVAGSYAKGFTFLVLPPLLMIPAGLSLIFGLLSMQCQGFDNEVHMLRLGGLFSVVFCLATAAAFLAFYLAETTVLYLQAHVLATSLFCVALALGCGQILRRVGVFSQDSQAAGDAAARIFSLE